MYSWADSVSLMSTIMVNFNLYWTISIEMNELIETMSKLDIKKEFKQFYKPSAKQVEMVDVPKFNFLMVDGEGGPDGTEAKQAIEALYPISYKAKFLSKAKGKDYVVAPLEGLWWADDMKDFETGKRENWKFTYMIMQPDFVTTEMIEEARSKAAEKKDIPALSKVRFESFKEGKAAQIMHIGPFSEEHDNIMRLHDKIAEIGGKLSGKHHEIYLSDFRKVDPQKMKTVLRQPYESGS